MALEEDAVSEDQYVRSLKTKLTREEQALELLLVFCELL